jgi:CubicO group peptidase (beta-lactamase class C family)
MDKAEDIVQHRASGYTPVKDEPGVFMNAKFYPYTYPGPAGGLRSTVGDLTKFHGALLNGEIVGRELLAQMLTPARVKDGRLTSEATWSEPEKPAPKDSPYAFGIGISDWEGHKRVGHSGGILGFSSALYSFPDDGVTIAILTNSP